MASLRLIADQPIQCALGILVAYISGYIIYQRFLHPLAKFPGPFLASLTDLWQVYQFITLKQPYTLTKLHERYGSVVRYGPDKLSITDEDAVRVIYQTGGRYMPKTEFYDAYGATHPNVFGMRDEAVREICPPEIESFQGLLILYSQGPLHSTAAHVAQLLHELRQRNGAISRFKHQNLTG